MPSYYSTKRPVIQLPATWSEIILEFIGILAILGTLFLLAKYWTILPQKIPTHFGISGKPDGWGGKESLLFLPVLGIIMYASMWFVSKYPHIYNYPVQITEENAPFQYLIGRKMINWLRTFLVILFGYLEWVSIKTALGESSGLGPWFIIVILLFAFVPLIFYIWKSIKQ